jgi:hypothetical protein
MSHTAHMKILALSNTLANELDTSVSAYILTPSGKCLSAVNGGGIGNANPKAKLTALNTDATSPGPTGVFKVVQLKNSTFALQTSDGLHYVTAVRGGGIGDSLTNGASVIHRPIVTDGALLSFNARFRFIPISKEHFALRTADGKHYITAVNGGGIGTDDEEPIHTSATTIGPNETFTLYVELLFTETRNGPG